MAKKNKTESEQADLAVLFKALGDPIRLDIFRYLRTRCAPIMVEHGEEAWMRIGPSVGEICCHVTGVDRVTSAISFHLKELRMAGLILVERRGKNMIYSVSPQALEKLGGYFGPSAVGAKSNRGNCCVTSCQFNYPTCFRCNHTSSCPRSVLA